MPSREPPLSLQQDYMNLICYMRLQRIPESSTSTLVFNPLEDSRSYGRKMRNLVEDFSLNLSKVLAVGTPQFLHWTNLVELDLVGIGKEPSLQQSKRLDILGTFLLLQLSYCFASNQELKLITSCFKIGLD